MRILWIFEHLATQSQLQRVAYRLAARPDVTLEVMCRWTDAPPFDGDAIQVSRVSCRHKLDFAARRVIRRKLDSTAFDLVHAYSSRDLANLVGARRRGPKLVGYRGTVNRLQRFDPAHWITFWHPSVSKIICVCNATERTLRESNVADSKLTTVWEGCDSDLFKTPPRNILAEYQIPPDAFVVGTVANMRPVKGVDVLIRAARQLTDLSNIYWMLVGDVRDPQIPRLAADTRISDRVRLVGAQPNGGRFAGLFDVYVAPSRMEGLSMGIMEAMAQRICPVVTNVGGSPELIRNEIDGLVVPPEDPEAIASAIRRLYHAPVQRNKLAASAQQRVRDEFSTENWANRLYRAYCDILEKTPQSGPILSAA